MKRIWDLAPTKKWTWFVGFVLLSTQAFAQQSPSDIETLVSTNITTINLDGSSVMEAERTYKVVTEAGRSKLAYDTVNFNRATQTFQIVEAFVVNEGKKFPVESSRVAITALSQLGPGLNDYRQAVIPFPMLKVGSVATVKYKLTTKPRAGKIFSEAIAINNSSLAKREYYVFKSKGPISKYEENTGDYFLVENGRDSRTQENIVRLFPSPMAYSTEGVKVEQAVVFISNTDKWLDINKEISGKYNSALEMPLPSEFQAIVDEAKAMASPKEQIEFVTKRLTKMVAYSGDWSTAEGQIFPKGHEKVVKDGNGDCKDYSTSLAAMLRRLGYQSNVALSFRSQKYFGMERLKKMAAVPNLSVFNHAIVWAKDKAGKVWWLDPTNPLVIADMIATDILGNYALILDGKSGHVEFLPEKNVDETKVEISQEITINPDFSVSGTGTMKMDHSTYNSIAIAERSQGIEITKKIIDVTLNFGQQKKMELQKIEGDVPQYKFSYIGSQWIEKSGAQASSIKLVSPAALYLIQNRPKAEAGFGEPGTFEMKTVVKNTPLYDGVDGSCYVRSKWIDLDRVVRPVGNDIQITDSIRIKARYVSKQEASTDDFETTYFSLLDCAKSGNIVTLMDPKEKTQAFIELEAKKGPAVDKMTDADADKLDKLSGPVLLDYRSKKLIQYYTKKIEANPKDAMAYNLRSGHWLFLGYRSGDNYVPEHLDAAIQDIAKAIELSGTTIVGKMHFKKIKFLGFRGKQAEASTEFLKIYKAIPNDFYTALSAILIGRKQKNYAYAEQWGKAVSMQNRTDDEKEAYYYQMQRLMSDQNKDEEAIKYQEKLVEADPNDPWQLHNLAVQYFYSKTPNIDRIIELETKALAIAEFGVARKLLADAYLSKAKNLQMSVGGREPASVSKAEELILTALKWDPSNLDGLVQLVQYYVNQTSLKRDKSYLTKAHPYVEKLLRDHSDKREALMTQMIYSSMQKVNFAAPPAGGK